MVFTSHLVQEHFVDAIGWPRNQVAYKGKESEKGKHYNAGNPSY